MRDLIGSSKMASFADRVQDMVPSKAQDPIKQHQVRPSAATGRTIFVVGRASASSASTPAAAFFKINKLVSQQHVRTKFHTQKFHERRALKKKRLLRERARRRFKAGFKAAVDRVHELKKQGW